MQYEMETGYEQWQLDQMAEACPSVEDELMELEEMLLNGTATEEEVALILKATHASALTLADHSMSGQQGHSAQHSTHDLTGATP